MNEAIIRIFALFGAVSVFCVAWFTLAVILEWLHEQIKHFKHTYCIRHRYNKKPIAECHCGDCVWFEGDHDDLGAWCKKVSRYMCHDGFCSMGLTKDINKGENE